MKERTELHLGSTRGYLRWDNPPCLGSAAGTAVAMPFQSQTQRSQTKWRSRKPPMIPTPSASLLVQIVGVVDGEVF